jgi:type IV pilus assembly protein PilY1
VDSNNEFKIVGSDFTYGTGTSNRQGWYFDFLNSERSGERIVTNPVVADGNVFFNTLIPGAYCEKGGGRSYSLDALTGLSTLAGTTGYISEMGALAAPVVFQTGAIQSETLPTGLAKIKRKFIVVNFGTSGGKRSVAHLKTSDVGQHSLEERAKRLGWREVLNWQELHDAANRK